ILSVTADNASNNDAMVCALSELVPAFGGAPSQTCCFLHVVNLVVKLLIHQFN
ncbi:hypothetical protein OG21DRAFT_1368066, partial [Imleria badia]